MSTSLGKEMVYAWTLQTPGQRVGIILLQMHFLPFFLTINFSAAVSTGLHIDESSQLD